MGTMTIRFTRMALLAVLAAGAHAQVPATIHQGASTDDCGRTLSAAGDVDLDGFDDWAVGCPFADDGAATNAGRVHIYSGRTLTILRTLVGLAPEDKIGQSLAPIGDVDADGYPDLIVGGIVTTWPPTDPGRARIYSGFDGSIPRSLAGATPGSLFGFAVAGMGDVNGDGRPDAAVGAPYDSTNGNYAGKVVVSGLDGTVLFTLFGTGNNQQFGRTIAGGHDLDSDGVADLVVGVTNVNGNTGMIRAYSGATHVVLFTTPAPVNGQSFGHALDFCGDIDQDGTSDLVVGSYYGHAAIVSGASGGVLFTFTGPLADSFGSAVCAAGDTNGDGVPDVVVSSPTADPLAYNSGWVRICSGADGSILATISNSGAQDPFIAYFGERVAAVGDTNADGTPDFLAGAPHKSLARLILGGCPPPELYCTAKSNSLGCTPQLAFSGAQSLTSGSVLTVTASNVISHAPGMLFFGSQRATIPFGGGTLCATGSPIVRTPIQGAGGTAGVVDCSGSYTFHFTGAYMASKGLVPGSRVCAQFYSRDNGFASPNNIGLTGGIEFLVCPRVAARDSSRF